MAQKHGQAAQQDDPGQVEMDAAVDDRQRAFADIQRQGRQAGQFALAAQHVGGPDVAAARGADILAFAEIKNQVAERDGAQQVGTNDKKNLMTGQGRISFNSL